MAKKIYDIVPPKVKAKAAQKSLDSKPKVRKPRKKAVLDTPEIMTPDTMLQSEILSVLPDDLTETPKTKKSPQSDAMTDLKVEPVVPKKKSFDINMMPDTDIPASAMPAPKSAPLNMDSNIGLGKPKPKPLPPSAPKSAPTPMASSSMINDDEEPQEKKHHVWLWILGILFLVVLGAGIYFYFALQKANVQIWPKTEALSFQDSIGLDKSLQAVDFDKKIIPARIVEIEKEDVQEFLPTSIASSDVKASGTITIYNKISPASSFSLKSGTHFLSDSGKYFVTVEKVTVPAATTVKGKLTPGAINVKVQAEDVGPDYNIKASKFSIPKLSGTEYYYTVWGESDNPMTGGYTGSVKKVSKSDLSQAKDTLTKKLFSQAEEALKQGLSADEVLLDTNLTKVVVSADSDVKVDAVVEKFNETAKVKVSGLVFNKKDLEGFAKKDIVSHLTNNKVLLEKSLGFNYTPKTIDVSGGVAALDVTVSAKQYQDVNQNDLINVVSGKSSDQIREDLDKTYNNGGVEKVKINFSPFWVSRAPKDKNKVTVDVIFE
jgi:hypothetical protein